MKTNERITSMITFLAGIGIMYYAWHTLKLGSIHVPAAGFMPFLCGAGMTVLSVFWFVGLRAKEEQAGVEATEKRFRLRPYISLALMVLYAWALEMLGYITSTLIFMIAWQQIIEREKWIKTIIITLLGTFAMYALFSLFLKVPVPQELFLR